MLVNLKQQTNKNNPLPPSTVTYSKISVSEYSHPEILYSGGFSQSTSIIGVWNLFSAVLRVPWFSTIELDMKISVVGGSPRCYRMFTSVADLYSLGASHTPSHQAETTRMCPGVARCALGARIAPPPPRGEPLGTLQVCPRTETLMKPRHMGQVLS